MLPAEQVGAYLKAAEDWGVQRYSLPTGNVAEKTEYARQDEQVLPSVFVQNLRRRKQRNYLWRSASGKPCCPVLSAFFSRMGLVWVKRENAKIQHDKKEGKVRISA